MENSVEEDIALIEKSLCDKDTIIQYHYWVGTDFLNAVERIVADYKRVLKENEELKQEKINNDRMIVLAQNEALNYMRGYEDGKNSRGSAVACQIENQQYFLFDKQIEKYKEYIEKLQRENEEKTTILLAGAEKVKQLEKENEELKKFITEGITVAPHSTYKNYRLDFLRENFVSKKKIKDKIEEIDKEIKREENEKVVIYLHKQRKILQELLEGRE